VNALGDAAGFQPDGSRIAQTVIKQQGTRSARVATTLESWSRRASDA
jgi:hypothetical protein